MLSAFAAMISWQGHLLSGRRVHAHGLGKNGSADKSLRERDNGKSLRTQVIQTRGNARLIAA